MSVTNKIKALLNLYDKEQGELVSFLKMSSRQALNNKLHRGSFSAEDLIKIADFLGCELAYIVKGNQKIILDTDDIRPAEIGKDKSQK